MIGGLIMRFEAEIWERYSISQNKAKRAVRKAAANGMESTLPLMESVLDENKIVNKVELGEVNIPVNQIVGVVSNEDQEYYSADFLPLPSVESGFAEKWTRIYMEHLTDRGLEEPIRCYEYLGKFYVIDGKKRVSVLKADGTIMVRAYVTRIMPEKTEDDRVRSYYEFVDSFEKTGLYQIAFTQPGKTDAFLNAIGYKPDYVWTDSDRYGFIFNWYSFERAMKIAFDALLNITTADAVMVLLKEHSFTDLIKLHSWTLAEMMQDAWLEMYQISNPNFRIRCAVTQKAS